MMLFLSLLSFVACKDPLPYEGAFDLPIAAAVVQPEVGGPFLDPVGYVASAHSGQISILSLKQALQDPTTGQVTKGSFLSDDPTSPFLRGAPLATGRDRLLTALAAWAPDRGTIHLFAGDAAFGQLLRVPHVTGVDASGYPIEPEPTASEPVFTDTDGNGDAPTLTALTLKPGYSATETWTVTFDGDAWTVDGSRSGRMSTRAAPGEPFVGERRAIAFTIEGEATAGDQFVFATDSGLVEYDLGGVPTALAMSPDQSTLAVVVDVDAGAKLLWVDPATGEVSQTFELPAGAVPGRLAWRPDGVLFVADRALPAAYAIAPDAAIAPIALPWPVLDLAPLDVDDEHLLYLAPEPLGDIDARVARQVWLYDLDAATFRDTNPFDAGDQGIDVRASIAGLEAIPMAFDYPETDTAGAQREAPAVAVALGTGRVTFVEASTGCLLHDANGPRSSATSQTSPYDYTDNFSADAEDTPRLEPNAETDGAGRQRHVVVNACAGIAPTEQWLLRYDRGPQGWIVEGSISGVQTSLAYDDVRYVSDEGAIALTVRANGAVPVDGWKISFSVLDGALAATGDGGDDDQSLGNSEPRLSSPTDPVYFHYRVGPTGGAWDPVDDRVFLLVVAAGDDLVARVNPMSGQTEVVWQ